MRSSALLDLTFSICRVVCQANPADAARQTQIWKKSSQDEIRLKSVPRKVPTKELTTELLLVAKLQNFERESKKFMKHSCYYAEKISEDSQPKLCNCSRVESSVVSSYSKSDRTAKPTQVGWYKCTKANG